MAFAEIANITIDRSREDGTSRSFDIALLERDAVAAASELPLEGSVVIEEGARGDDVLKSIRPTVVQFRLKDKTDLAKRIIDGEKRQFKLIIDETVSGRREFEGFIRPDIKDYDLFAGVQTVKLTATGELSSLAEQNVQDQKESLASFFERIGDDIELSRDVDFYTRLRYDGQAQADPIPDLLRLNEYQVIGATEGNRADAVAQMLQQGNWQLFQLDGRLVVADAYERMTNPTAVNKYSGPAYGQSTEDVTISIDKNTSIKRPTGTGSQRVAEIIQQWQFGKRRQSVFPPVDFTRAIGKNETYPRAYEAIALGGDEFIIEEWNGYISKASTTGQVEGDLRFGQAVFESYIGGGTYYYNFDTEEWQDTDYRLEDHIFMSSSTDSTLWGIELPGGDPITVAPLPEGELGEFRLETIFEMDMTIGTIDDFTEMAVTDIYVTENEVEGPEQAYHQYSASNGAGQVQVYTLFSAGLDRYNAAQLGNAESALEYSTDGGTTWDDANGAWVDGGSTDLLARISARRKGELLIGDVDRIHLRVRDLAEINPLTVIQFNDGETTRPYSTVCIRHELFEGYYEIWMRPSPMLAMTESDYYSLEAAEGESGSAGSSGGGGSTGGGNTGDGSIPEHGELPGLGDDDHPQYFNQERGDARYVRPNTTPTLDQVVLNNPASADNHAVRGGTVIQTTAPISGGDKVRNGINLGLSYNSTNLSTPGGSLDTIQDIHQDAEMILKTLMLKEGLTVDDILGYLTSETFLDGFGGDGIELRKRNGNWKLTVDDLVVRRLARFYEIALEKIRYNAGTVVIGPGGEKITDASQTGDASWDFNATGFNPFAGDSLAGGVEYTFADQYECFIEEDKYISIVPDDLLRRQQWNGRGTGVTEGGVIATETGSATETDNTPRRSFTMWITNDSEVPGEGMEFAVIGNRTDPERQNCIIITASDAGNPYERMLVGVDRLDKFGSIESIKKHEGRLDSLNFSDIFPELDGTLTNKFGTVWPDGDLYANNAHIRGKIVITDEAGSNAATKAYVDDQAGGNVTMRASSAPTTRPGGGSLESGDVWIDTSSNDRIYSWDGSTWNASETVIDGSRISITLDQVADGGNYQRTAESALDANGLVIMSQVSGDLDDIDNGTNYQKTASSALDASGLVIMSQVTGDLDDVSDGGTYQRTKSAALTADGLVLLSQASGNLDDISNGGTYAKVLKTEVSAGHIIIKGPNGNTVIDQGTIDTDALFANTANITNTLTMGASGEITNSNGDFLIGSNGFQFIAGNTGSDGGPNQLEWFEGSDLTGHIYSYRDTGPTPDENLLVVRAPTNGGSYPSTIFLTASKTQVQADLEVNGFRSTYKQDTFKSDTGEIAIDVNAPVVLLSTSNSPRICRLDLSSNVEEVPGKIIFVTFINTGSVNWYFKDKSTASLSGSNIKSNNQDYEVTPGTKKTLALDVDSGNWYTEVDHGA